MQGAVTLVTMAIPIIFSLLALVRVEHYRSTQDDKLHHDREVVAQQTTLLDEGQALSIPRESLQASYQVPLSSLEHAFQIPGIRCVAAALLTVAFQAFLPELFCTISRLV